MSRSHRKHLWPYCKLKAKMGRLAIIFLGLTLLTCKPQDSEDKKPKLVVGLIVDQMRFEILERLDPIFGEGGFRRLKKEGFQFRNCYYSHAQTLTAPGHATIAAGAPPSVHGIAANSWYDKATRKKVYAVNDPEHFLVRRNGIDSSGNYSPRNLNSETIGDAFKNAYGNEARVVGISGKNRAAILSAGKDADLALWIDPWNYWTSSTYFLNELPGWVASWNEKGALKKYENEIWEPLLGSYPGTTDKEVGFERSYIGQPHPGWPKDFSVTVPKNGPRTLLVSPYLNTEIIDLSIKGIVEMGLGNDEVPDYLAISISGTDKIGHAYGPHSEETADAYLRLDRDIEKLLNFLDSSIGKDDYLLFLTADHGIANIPGRIDSVNSGGGRVSMDKYLDSVNMVLAKKHGDSNLVIHYYDEQIWVDWNRIDEMSLDKQEVKKDIVSFYESKNGISHLIEPGMGPQGKEYEDLVLNGFVPRRSGDFYVVYEPGFVEDWKSGVDHGSPHDYDRHVPLIWFGKGVRPGVSLTETIIPDIALTLCDLLGIDAPKQSTGVSRNGEIYSE